MVYLELLRRKNRVNIIGRLVEKELETEFKISPSATDERLAKLRRMDILVEDKKAERQSDISRFE